ncbi:MAG: Proteasome subunit alpha type-4 [Watsoniomyces obsoletus]|nr:MAG: Proteasome subunit alpha type-4 [Watsoniomyces obsoletus]
MAGSEREQTDDTSIRPVSSLRSHFENIAGAKSQPSVGNLGDASTRLQVPQAAGSETNSRSSSRVSLDRPNDNLWPEAAKDADQNGPPKPRQAPPPPRPRSISPMAPPPRPVSTGAFHASDSQPTETVTVVKPRESAEYQRPARDATGIQNQDRGLLRPTLMPPPTSPSRHTRVTSSPISIHTERLASPLVGEPRTAHPGAMNYDSMFSARPHVSKPSLQPPPVNRAEKPKQFSLTTAFQPGSAGSASDGSMRATRTVPQSAGTPSDVKSYISHFASFEPPPVKRSLTHQLRETRIDEPSTPFNVECDRRHSTAYPQHTNGAFNQFRPGLPPRRESVTPSPDDVRRPSLTRAASASPARHAERAPISSSFKISNNVSQYPPPPLRSNTSNSLDGNDAPPSLPVRPVELEPTRRPSVVTLPARSVPPSNRSSVIYSEVQDTPTEQQPQSINEYPDSSRANRRKPLFRQGPHEIPAKHDAKLIALCGEHLCCTGHLTKVFDVRDGETILTLNHGEGVRVTSLAFKPTVNADDEGRWLWLGTSHGEIQEIDLLEHVVAYVKSSAHPRREVVKIHASGDEMWTLDDEGRLHVWPPDETGSSSLRQSHVSFRVPKGPTFSLAVGRELWIANGRDIRVFRPSSDPEAQFDVLAKPLSQPRTGDVTSGAAMGNRSNKVFFGHTDGKVTVYSRRDYTCLEVINVSLYKISSLAAVGDHLWAGFNTGMLYVYDTNSSPWMVKKDWHAHESPVADIIVDHSRGQHVGLFHVATLGTDNIVRLWDGSLREDWLESQMHEHDEEYCEFREVSALVTTFNVGACTPLNLRRSEEQDEFLRGLLRSQEPPEILVFGFQELVDLEDKKVTAKSLFRSSKKKETTPDHEGMSRQYRAWRDYLTGSIDDYMPADHRYELLHTATMVGLFTCVFVKSSERPYISSVDSAEVKCGMGGLYGNKGALLLRFVLDDSSLGFVNCHLAAGQSHTQHRHNDIAAILEAPVLPFEQDLMRRIHRFVGGGDGSLILDHEICILNGDLNYRIDTIGRDSIISAIKANNLSKLLERDQLLLSRRKNPGFRLRAFNEAPITFAPTYKYDPGTDTYDSSEKKRAPAWCDRVLYRGFGRIKQVDYRRHELRISDHRPVSGLFRIRVKRIIPEKHLQRWELCEQAFEAYRERLVREAQL